MWINVKIIMVIIMKKKIIKLFFFILLLLNLFLIFYMSFQNGEDSTNISSGFIDNTIGSINNGEVLDYLENKYTYDGIHAFFRKSAHFLEFFLLGFILSINLLINNKYSSKSILYIIVTIYIIATYDELFQGLNNRGVNFYDTLIDLLGGLISTFLFYLIILKKKGSTN